jgi:hypothetical protein
MLGDDAAQFGPSDRIQLTKRICSNGANPVTIHRSLMHTASKRLVLYSRSLETYVNGCHNYVCELQLPEQIEAGNWEVDFVVEVPINHFKIEHMKAEPVKFVIVK